MGLGLKATDKVENSECIERLSNALFIFMGFVDNNKIYNNGSLNPIRQSGLMW